MKSSSSLFCTLFAVIAVLQLHAVPPVPDENIDDPAIRINELVIVNESGALDELGEQTPWIELYNKRDLTYTMVGFFLSDDSTNVFKWEIPQGTQIASRKYLIVWMDGDEEQGVHHANFTLHPEGGSLWLVNQEGEIQDRVDYGPQSANVAYARVPNGEGDWALQAPTYSANNNWPVGVEDFATHANFTVYPNPVASLLFIQHATPESKELLVFNAVGKLMLREPHLESNFKLDVSQWPSGMYMLKVGEESQSVLINH